MRMRFYPRPRPPIAAPPRLPLKGSMKWRAASTRAARFRPRSVRPALPPASTFVFGKTREVSQSEACQFFDIAFARLPSPVQMSLEQATTVVRDIDVIMGRPVNRPRGIYGLSYRDFIGHFSSSGHRNIRLLATPLQVKVSSFSRRRRALEASTGAHSLDTDKPHGQPTETIAAELHWAVMELAPEERPDSEVGERGRGVQTGDVPVWSSCETAAANCAGAKGFSIRTLPSTPCDFQSGALALVM